MYNGTLREPGLLLHRRHGNCAGATQGRNRGGDTEIRIYIQLPGETHARTYALTRALTHTQYTHTRTHARVQAYKHKLLDLHKLTII